MTCSSCVASIERNLSKVNGIHGILVALLSQKAEVLYNSDRIDSNKIIDMLEDLGFGASLISETVNAQLSQISFRIVGMTCSSCVQKIESTLAKLEGKAYRKDEAFLICKIVFFWKQVLILQKFR